MDDMEMMVPQLTGDVKEIQLLKFSKAVKTWDYSSIRTDVATGTCSKWERGWKTGPRGSKRSTAYYAIRKDTLHSSIVEWPQIRTESLLSNYEGIRRRAGILQLLPNQQPWSCPVNQKGVEIPPGGLLQNGPLWPHDGNNGHISQLIPPALQYRPGCFDQSDHHHRKPLTRAHRFWKIPPSLRLQHMEWTSYQLMDQVPVGKGGQARDRHGPDV